MEELGYGSADDQIVAAVAWEANSTSTFTAVDEKNPLSVPACPDLHNFNLLYTAPVVGRFALQGQVDKWTPFASSRFSKISATEEGLAFTVQGSEGETVKINCIEYPALKQHQITVT